MCSFKADSRNLFLPYLTGAVPDSFSELFSFHRLGTEAFFSFSSFRLLFSASPLSLSFTDARVRLFPFPVSPLSFSLPVFLFQCHFTMGAEPSFLAWIYTPLPTGTGGFTPSPPSLLRLCRGSISQSAFEEIFRIRSMQASYCRR